MICPNPKVPWSQANSKPFLEGSDFGFDVSSPCALRGWFKGAPMEQRWLREVHFFNYRVATGDLDRRAREPVGPEEHVIQFGGRWW